MVKPLVYVTYGKGIGCHEECAHAYEKAGANTRLVHFNELLGMSKEELFKAQAINLAGGFMHGDMLGSAVAAANEIESYDGGRLKEYMLEFAAKGNIIYGQCNGFQLLVKTGLLPGIEGESKPTLTLAGNDNPNYWVEPLVPHGNLKKHFIFEGIGQITPLYLWCRHGEGKITFNSEYSTVSKEEGEENRRKVNENNHVLLRYVDPSTMQATEDFPYNPNGSVDGIAGLVDCTGNIIGHMGHTEVGVYKNRDVRWSFHKNRLRVQGFGVDRLTEHDLEGVTLQIFKNIVKRFS